MKTTRAATLALGVLLLAACPHHAPAPPTAPMLWLAYDEANPMLILTDQEPPAY